MRKGCIGETCEYESVGECTHPLVDRCTDCPLVRERAKNAEKIDIAYREFCIPLPDTKAVFDKICQRIKASNNSANTIEEVIKKMKDNMPTFK